MAYLEAKVMLSMILQKYRFEMEPDISTAYKVNLMCVCVCVCVCVYHIIIVLAHIQYIHIAHTHIRLIHLSRIIAHITHITHITHIKSFIAKKNTQVNYQCIERESACVCERER